MGFRSLVSLLPAIQATRLLVFALVGLSPTERASLRWTHRPTAGSRGSCAGSAPNLGVNRWTAAEVAGLPVPVGAEPASMPLDHRLGLDDYDRAQQRWVQSIEPHHQQAIDVQQPHALRGFAP